MIARMNDREARGGAFSGKEEVKEGKAISLDSNHCIKQSIVQKSDSNERKRETGNCH